MEYVKISKEEYEKLLKYRDIVSNLKDEAQEELNVRQITDKRAIKVLRKLEKEAKEGKRKTISHKEFAARHRELFE